MALNTAISAAAAEAMLNAITTLLDTGGAGTLKIFTGSAPTNCGLADSGTLLATFTLNATAFAAATGTGVTDGIMTANSIATVNAGNTGTAGYFRVYDHSGNCVAQGTCGTSSADMVLGSTSIVSGGAIAITSWTITMPSNGT